MGVTARQFVDKALSYEGYREKIMRTRISRIFITTPATATIPSSSR